MPKQRLDVLMVDLNLCDTRQQAQRLIRAGEVTVNQQRIDKPGTEVETSAIIQVKQKPPYVSRGGEKLVKALQDFKVPVEGRICLDGGISTGGFTDCLLQAGAAHVYGIDVGYGQVDWSIRQNPKVTLFERTNLRHMEATTLYGDDRPWANLGVVDVSFISLTKVISALWNLLQEPREVILLVKPQFEVGRDRVGKNGVVRDPKDQTVAILQVLDAAQQLGWNYCGLTWSPLLGPAGNIEYLLWLKVKQDEETAETLPSPDLKAISQIVQAAHQALTK